MGHKKGEPFYCQRLPKRAHLKVMTCQPLVSWNRRLLFLPLLMVLPAAAAVYGVLRHGLASNFGWIHLTILILALLGLVLPYLLLRPLVAIMGKHIRFQLGPQPVLVPAEVVECCFMGSGPSELKGSGGQPFNARHLVFRLADNAPEFHAGPTNPHVAKWCGGYITLYGLLAENLNKETADAINQSLVHLHRRIKEESSVHV